MSSLAEGICRPLRVEQRLPDGIGSGQFLLKNGIYYEVPLEWTLDTCNQVLHLELPATDVTKVLVPANRLLLFHGFAPSGMSQVLGFRIAAEWDDENFYWTQVEGNVGGNVGGGVALQVGGGVGADQAYLPAPQGGVAPQVGDAVPLPFTTYYVCSSRVSRQGLRSKCWHDWH